jgi:hypothetical protein
LPERETGRVLELLGVLVRLEVAEHWVSQGECENDQRDTKADTND